MQNDFAYSLLPFTLAADDIDSLALEMRKHLEAVQVDAKRPRPRDARSLVFGTGPAESEFGFQLSLAIAKAAGLHVDLLAAEDTTDNLHHQNLDWVTLDIAGIPFDQRFGQGPLGPLLLDFIGKHPDIAAIVVGQTELDTHEFDRIRAAVLPRLQASRLPGLFVVNNDRVV